MAIPLIRTIGFTKGLREALPFINSLVKRNPIATTESILAAARDAGLRFTNAPARQLVTQLKNNADLLKRFKVRSLDAIPPDAAFGLGEAPLKKNYAYQWSITGYNAFTGERETRYVTVASNKRLSFNDAYESMLGAPDRTPGSQVLSNTTYELEGALRSPLAR
jgi:hypothetical protein